MSVKVATDQEGLGLRPESGCCQSRFKSGQSLCKTNRMKLKPLDVRNPFSCCELFGMRNPILFCEPGR